MRNLVGLLLATTLAGPAYSAPDPVADQIRSIIGNSKGLEGPGCAIGVLKDGKRVITVIDGAADIAAKKPIDADTQIYTASVAKQFTALAIAQLAVANKLSMDDDVRKYLPEMRQYRAPITVAMLVHHTAGIRDMLELGVYAGYGNSASVDRASALKLVFAQADTAFVPGTQHRYSNSGYLLLSIIVERASGMSFADYMKKNVFGPLGMKRSWVLTGARSADANVAHGYASDGAGFKLADTHPLYGGAGGAVFTLNDLVKYDYDINVGHKVWTPAVARIMLAPGTLSNGAPATTREGRVYAGGVSLNGPWTQHGGAGEGFQNMVAWLPDGQLSIHVLCNNGAAKSGNIAERVVDTLGRYPSLSEAPPFAGRYVSDDLSVFYDLAPLGENKMTLSIEPQPGGLGRKRVVELTRGTDGAFATKGFRIVLDADRRGFALGTENGRVGILRFRRAN